MTDLNPEARAIIEAGRDGDGPGDLERARVRRALMAKIAALPAAGAATLAAQNAAASGATGATTSLPLAKILIPLAIVVAGGVGGTVAWRAKHAPAPVVVAAPVAATAPVAPVAPSVVIVPVPFEVPAPAPARVRHAHAAPAAHALAPTNRLAEETALLAASNAELRGGDARHALALLNDYESRYPSGVLREEVLATRVIARCQLGDAPDAAARRAARVFLSRHPSSPLASRVRTSCEP